MVKKNDYTANAEINGHILQKCSKIMDYSASKPIFGLVQMTFWLNSQTDVFLLKDKAQKKAYNQCKLTNFQSYIDLNHSIDLEMLCTDTQSDNWFPQWRVEGRVLCIWIISFFK